MTSANLIFTIVGGVALIAGLVTLLRPGLVRALLNIPATEPARYGLLIGGMMLAAFGLLLATFAIVYSASGPTDMTNRKMDH